MQPEPNELSQKDSSIQNTQEISPASQYGLNNSVHEPLPQPRARGGKDNPRRSTSTRASSASSRGSYENLEGSLGRLSSGSRPHTRSPVSRIEEHEKALTNLSKRKNEGPTFTVVQKGRNLGTDQPGLADFPNGLPPFKYW